MPLSMNGCEVDPDAVGVADDLPHRFVKREHQAALPEARPFRQVVQAHDALADA